MIQYRKTKELQQISEEINVPVTSGESSQRSLPLDQMIENHIREAMKYSQGKINGPKGAAEILGINPSTLRKRMTKLNIPFG